MRTSGSMLSSGRPSVASSTAIWRATSQLTGPWLLNSLARSPKMGSCSKGLPDGPDSAMRVIVSLVPSIAVIGADRPVARAVVRGLGPAHDVVLAPGAAVAAGAETVVHLDGDVAGARRLLREGSTTRTFVYASTAMVYGAWPNNPVPLTEDAPLRPNPGFTYAASRAEIERAALEWREADDGRRLAVLRPTTVLADEDDRLTRLLRDVLPSG